MRRIFLFILIFSIIIQSCHSISKDDVTIIDGVRLGETQQSFYKLCDSIGLMEQIFYTDIIFNDYKLAQKSKIKCYTTNILNFSEYRTPKTQHYGIYYPITLGGTDYIIGLNVLLIHTGQAVSRTKSGIYNLTEDNNIWGINQDISIGHQMDIERMLSEKYGPPKDTIWSQFTSFYGIEGNQIKNFHSDSLRLGGLYQWRTRYLDVSYFGGIRNPSKTFFTNGSGYNFNFNADFERVIDYDKGERSCYSYSFISYKLNHEAIKELKLETKL